MEIREFTKKDIAQASELLANRHKKERYIFPSLKRKFEESKQTEKQLAALIGSSYVIGVAAYENDNLQGFIISNIRTDGLGNRCAWVGYESFAIADSQAPELYRKLYAEIAKIWVKNGALQHIVVIPAGYPQVVNSWLRLSFAFEQVYGVASLAKSEVSIPDNLIIREAGQKDSEELKKVSNLIYSYQAKSPTFSIALPEKLEQLRAAYAELPNDEDEIAVVAYHDDKLVGFQCAYMEDNDSVMMTPEKSLEIEIAGIREEARGRGIGKLLTDIMYNKALEKGFENAFADWKISNLSASNFWPQTGFQAVAYKMVRHLDERIFWADGLRELQKRV